MLHLHRAERADRLAEALGEVLREPLDDPFTAEVIAVPARGVERWLSQRLSCVLGTGTPRAGGAAPTDGVSAHLLFPGPDQLVARAGLGAGGPDPDDDPWAAGRLSWTVLEVVDSCLEEPWCAVLAAHLGNGQDGHRAGRRWATAAMLATRFGAYGSERPRMLQDWAAGRDTDGAGTALPDHLTWQPQLWRRLRAAIGTPSPAERLEQVCAALRAEPGRADLPARISFFGPTRLNTEQLAVLAALAAGREVHLWLPHPSPALWDWLSHWEQQATGGTGTGGTGTGGTGTGTGGTGTGTGGTGETATGGTATGARRREDPTGTAVTHPLLAGLARDTRELQQRLQPLVRDGRGTDTYHPPAAAEGEAAAGGEAQAAAGEAAEAGGQGQAAAGETAEGEAAEAGGQGQAEEGEAQATQTARAARTLLGTLQAAVRADRAPAPGSAPAGDGTVQVHACHGPARQVEVLREALLHAFEADPALEPRDVLVMCPDVEAYAPLVRAAFGQGATAGPDAHPGHRLRVRLADRSPARTNPLLDVVRALLELAGGRSEAGRVLDLAASAPVRRRFGFDDDDLARIRSWAAASGVRWGITGRDRREHGLGSIRQGTWQAGLDRLLLGVAADETELAWLERALPLDDVDSTDVDLAGRLSELVDRLWSVLAALGDPQPAASWARQLERGLTLLTDVPESDAWQQVQARAELADAVRHAGPAPLEPAGLRALLAERLAGRPTRANFRTGELTVATLVPMRSVPHRVIALLGLDDDVFPRGAAVDGDDVLALDPCLGERDRRSEDRQLLLDAVMSAGERLIVLYSGADPVTGASRPPAVPLGELLDVVTLACGADVVRRHPLQPFAPRAVDASDPFSFDVAALRGARAAVGPKRADPPLLERPLRPLQPADLDLADLVAFAQHPVQAFLNRRLGIRVPGEEGAPLDEVAAELDGLARWDVGERMLAARLRGLDPVAFRDAEVRRGTLPPLRLGARVLADLERAVDALAAACLPVHAGPAATVDVDLHLGDGRRLTGTVGGVHADVVAACSYSTLAAKHRIAAWVRLLAVAAAEPGRAWQAVTTGRGPFGQPTRRSTLRPPDDPMAALRDLVALQDAGLCEPLPLGPGASAVYADRRGTGSSVEEAAAAAVKEWEGRFGDGTDRHVGYVHGPAPRLGPLLERAASAAERACFDEPSRFGALSRRLWAPLLAHEEVTRP